MNSRILFFLGLFMFVLAPNTFAHDDHADATYIANEGVLVVQGDLKVMFDPFFVSGFGTYTEVPENMLNKIKSQSPPFDGIDAIFVSHVHSDHFDAKAMFSYLNVNKKAMVFLPEKGAQQLMELAGEGANNFKERVIAFDLKEGGKPKTISKGDITVDAVRIPHSGWPESRRDVNNIVFRVTLANGVTVAHLGDADTNDAHYLPYAAHWGKRSVDHAFPPYWYLNNQTGQSILKNRIRATAVTGVHVPIEVPQALIESGFDYFSKPGESRVIQINANSAD